MYIKTHLFSSTLYSCNLPEYEYFYNVLEYKYEYKYNILLWVLSTCEYLKMCTQVHEYTSTWVHGPRSDADEKD